MKKISSILTTITFIFCSCLSFATPPSCPSLFPSTTQPTQVESITYLCKTTFVIAYSTQRKEPLYVIERINASQLNGIENRSKYSFKQDPSIPPNQQADNYDYLHSGYDRGHMSPFENNRMNQTTANESFYYTNIAPQYPNLNRGIWKALENHIRDIAIQEKMIYVITGAVFDDSKYVKTGKIQVPSSFYKIVIKKNEIIAWQIPNIKDGYKNSLDEYQVDYKEIERITHIDFHIDR